MARCSRSSMRGSILIDRDRVAAAADSLFNAAASGASPQ
jgi:hypothetical protein